MKFLITILLLINLLFSQEYAQREVIVVYRDSPTIKQNANLKFKKLPRVVDNFKTSLVKSDSLSTKELIEHFSKEPNVKYVEPNYKYHLNVVPNDEYFYKEWGLKNSGQEINGESGTSGADINATAAWNVTTGSSNYVVAVLDTGVDYNHTDLNANIWHNSSECTNLANGVDDDNNGYVDDCYGYDFAGTDSGDNDYDPMPDTPYNRDYHLHGTHVAGIIGAKGNNLSGVAGVDWNTSIMAVKIFRPSGDGYSSDILEALEYVGKMKDRGVNIVAINASYGGGENSLIMKDAINALGDKGIIFVAAAGNSGNNIDHWQEYPASYECDNIVSVAATDFNDKLAYFSNYGKESVDIAAPGVDIYSTIPTDTHDEYKYLSGTSMATPYVAGSVALVWSALDSNLTGTAKEKAVIVKKHILGTSKVLNSLHKKVSSSGRLDLAMAVTNRVEAKFSSFEVRERRSSLLKVGGESSTDTDGDALTITNIDIAPKHATANVIHTADINYTPDNNFTGDDNLTATIKDALGLTTNIVVKIRVNPNNPPIAKNDTATVKNDKNITINVLLNDSDADGDILTLHSLTKLPEHGNATISNSKIVYSPNRDFVGTDTLKYQISDDLNATSEATVTIKVNSSEVKKKTESKSEIKHSSGSFNLFGILVSLLFILLLGIRKNSAYHCSK